MNISTKTTGLGLSKKPQPRPMDDVTGTSVASQINVPWDLSLAEAVNFYAVLVGLMELYTF